MGGAPFAASTDGKDQAAMVAHGRNPRTIFGLAALFLLLIVPLAACGGSGDDGSDASSAPETSQREISGDGEAGGGADADDGFAGAEEPASDALGDAMTIAYAANQVPLDRLIIRTVSISLTVESVADGSTWIRDLAARKGGFVFSANTYVRDESEFAQMTIRIPSDQLDSTVQELRDHQLVIQVDSEESTSQDVSQEYVDNESRLEALEETQRRFLALLSEADTIEEILRIESELTNIRSQIETIKGRQNYLDQMTSFSTVTITMHGEDDEFVEENEDNDGFLARIFGDSWDNASDVIEAILTGTLTVGIIGLAVLPFIAIAYVIARIAYRRTLGAAPAAIEVSEPVVEESSD